MTAKRDIQIILCRTWSPGNVGSALRALKNFGFGNLICCNQLNFNPEETAVMAAGAADLADSIVYSDDLPGRLADCHTVYAFTNRRRKHYQVLTPREMAAEIAALPEKTRVALLFGNETNGLNNEELDCADKIVMIPAEESYPSLNLAMAVLLALYELQLALTTAPQSHSAELPAAKEEKEQMVEEVTKVACRLIGKEVNNRQIADNISHFFKKNSITLKESRFIRSLFRIIARKSGI